MKKYEYGYLLFSIRNGYTLFDKNESAIISNEYSFLFALELASDYGWEVVQRYNNDDWLMKKEKSND